MPKRSDYRTMVYICSAYSGDVAANIEKTKHYCRYAVDHNCMPIAPHLMYPQFMDETTERELAIHMDLVFLGKCEEVWVIGNKLSKGMAIELEQAQWWGKHIRYFDEDMKEVFHD
ncbi:DUF4406 domain-containing protein [Enterococcus gallinarum]|uniref:DUF7768 domain-containing protein n=1 Tax=Enterococcus gallinarum TaxID=1353 RepID=UPI001BCDCB92|nr:DUF4406 domain-containing protein [Enterococcus gallinarum]